MFVCLARNSRSTPRLYTQAEQLGLEAAHLRGPQAQSRDPCRLAGDRVAEEHSVRGHGPPTAHDHFRRRLPRAAAVLSHSGLKANDRTQDFNVDIHQVLAIARPRARGGIEPPSESVREHLARTHSDHRTSCWLLGIITAAEQHQHHHDHPSSPGEW